MWFYDRDYFLIFLTFNLPAENVAQDILGTYRYRLIAYGTCNYKSGYQEASIDLVSNKEGEHGHTIKKCSYVARRISTVYYKIRGDTSWSE